MTAPANNATFYADFKSLAALKHEATTDSQKALRGAAQQFESLFINMMLKSARDATSSVGDSMTGGNEMDMYQSMFDEQVATQMAKNKGLGLADLLVQQLSRSGMVKGATANTGKTPASDGNGNPTPITKDVKPVGVQSLNTKARPLQTTSVQNLRNTAASSVTDSTAVSQKPAPRFSSPAEFVAKMWPHAKQAAEKLGVDPTTLIAHAALETGWGKHIPCQGDGSSSFNLFGIKAGSNWNGQSVGSATLEFDQGVAVKRVERFKAYDSAEQCFADYADLLASHPRYGATLNTGNNAAKFAQALQKGGYATDPDYAHKLKAVARSVMSLVNSITGGSSARFAGAAQAPSSHADS